MRATLPAIGALLFSVALLVLGNGLQNTLLPLRAHIEAFDPIEIGLLGSSYFLGFALGGLHGPRLVQRVGHIRAFTAMMAMASALVLIHPLAIDPVLWCGLRILSGICFAVLYVVIESWLNERATNVTRGAVFAVYALISFLMLGAAQTLLLLAPIDEYPLYLLSSILLSVAAVPVALTRAAAPPPIKPVTIQVRRLYADSPVGVVGCFAVGLAQGAFFTLGPLFARHVGSDAASVAVFMSAAVFAGAFGHWPLGWLSDRIDRRLVILGAGLGAALAGATLLFGRAAPWPLILAAAGAYGFFAIPLYTLSVALTNDFVERDRFVEAAGGLAVVWGAGAVIGPVVGSAAIGGIGDVGLFALTLSTHTLLAAFAAYRVFRRAPPPPEERGVFADALRVGQTVAPIDVIQAAPEEPAPEPGVETLV